MFSRILCLFGFHKWTEWDCTGYPCQPYCKNCGVKLSDFLKGETIKDQEKSWWK